MYDVNVTTNSRLDVEYIPVYIAYLTPSGLLPASHCKARSATPRKQEFRELPPSNLTENILMSMWVNTHQAMFMSTGMAAHCVDVATKLMAAQGDIDEIERYLSLARDARLASAAYTGLPHLTKNLYEAYIRESMRLVHPGFSGVSNQESIVMEQCLHALRQAQTELADRDRSVAQRLSASFEAVYSADQRWWRFHGFAMAKFVTAPISLARMDFENQQKETDIDRNFDEYRKRVLRDTKVQSDYDRYFAVQRKDDLSIADYRSQLGECLARSQPYVDADGDLAQYRNAGEVTLYQILDLEEERLLAKTTGQLYRAD